MRHRRDWAFHGAPGLRVVDAATARMHHATGHDADPGCGSSLGRGGCKAFLAGRQRTRGIAFRPVGSEAERDETWWAWHTGADWAAFSWQHRDVAVTSKRQRTGVR